PERPPERGKLFDPTHLPKSPPKEGAGAVFDHTWVGRSTLGPADHRATLIARPDPRFQTLPEHRPVDLGALAPEAGLFDTQPPVAPNEPELPALAPNEPGRDDGAFLFDADGPGEAPAAPAPSDPAAAPSEMPDPFGLAAPFEAPAPPREVPPPVAAPEA